MILGDQQIAIIKLQLSFIAAPLLGNGKIDSKLDIERDNIYLEQSYICSIRLFELAKRGPAVEVSADNPAKFPGRNLLPNTHANQVYICLGKIMRLHYVSNKQSVVLLMESQRRARLPFAVRQQMLHSLLHDVPD